MTLFENMGVAVVSRSQGCTGSLPHSPGPKASTIASWTDQMRGQGLHDTIGGFVPLFQRPLHHSTILSLLSCFVQKVSTPLVVKKNSCTWHAPQHRFAPGRRPRIQGVFAEDIGASPRFSCSCARPLLLKKTKNQHWWHWKLYVNWRSIWFRAPLSFVAFRLKGHGQF